MYQVLDLAPNLLMRSNCIAQITQSAGISLRGTSGVEKGLDQSRLHHHLLGFVVVGHIGDPGETYF